MIDDPNEPPAGEEAADLAPLVSWRGVVAWFALLGLLVLLDGWWGAGVAVVVAAVAGARLSRRVLGAMGFAALVAALVAVVVGGIPRADDVSPAFVTRSMLPHHLTFAGLALVSVWAVLDLLPHLVRARPATSERRRDADGRRIGTPSPVPTPVGVALVAIVALGAVAATVVVWQA